MQQATAHNESPTTNLPLTIDMVSGPPGLEPTEQGVEDLLAAYNQLRSQMGESANGLRTLLERLRDCPPSPEFEDGISQSIENVIVRWI